MSIDSIINFINQYDVLIVLISTLIGSMPFVGLLIPEELIVSLSVSLSQGGFSSIALISIASFFGMLVGQVIMYQVSKSHGEKVLKVLRLKESQIQSFKKIVLYQGFTINILFRLSSSSLFRGSAAILSGIAEVPFSLFLKYEVISSLLKTTGLVLIGILLRGDDNESLESVLIRVSVIMTILLVISFLISTYQTRRYLKEE